MMGGLLAIIHDIGDWVNDGLMPSTIIGLLLCFRYISSVPFFYLFFNFNVRYKRILESQYVYYCVGVATWINCDCSCFALFTFEVISQFLV